MKLIAITGGIGSGKSELINIIQRKGYATLSTDEIARNLGSDTAFIKKIASTFGEEYINENQIDRKKLANLVFSDNEKLAKLNELSHKLIIETMQQKVIELNQKIVFVEVPLLFESNLQELFSHNILIICNKSLRIERAKNRYNTTMQDIINRINNQLSDEEKIKRAEFVIENNSDLQRLENKFDIILGELLE